MAADRLYDGVIEIYDFAATQRVHAQVDEFHAPDGAPFYSVDVADVDADGQLEVVGGVGRAHTGSIGTFVYVYSYLTGAEEWHTFALTTGWVPISGLAVLTAGGGVADIVAMADGESLNFFSGTGQVQAIVNGQFSFLGPDASASVRSFLTGGDDGAVRQYQRQGPELSGGLDPRSWHRERRRSELPARGRDGGGVGRPADPVSAERDAPAAWNSEDYGVRGVSRGRQRRTRRPFVGGRYAVVSLAPWRTLLDVQPPIGPLPGGTLLTAFGTSFDPAAQLFVGGRRPWEPGA